MGRGGGGGALGWEARPMNEHTHMYFVGYTLLYFFGDTVLVPWYSYKYFIMVCFYN